MATKLKIIEDLAAIVAAPTSPDFTPAQTRNRSAGQTAERQRKFIEHLALTGYVGKAGLKFTRMGAFSWEVSEVKGRQDILCSLLVLTEQMRYTRISTQRC